MRKIFLYLFAIPALVLGLAACDSDDDQSRHDDNQPSLVDSVRFFAVCEGNYSRGNASITAIMKDGSIRQNFFQNINGRPLGDVAHYMTLIDNNFYIVLNNSGKIEVVDNKHFESQATIFVYNTNCQPRYVCGIGNNRAVISDASCDSLRIIDTESFEIVDRIYVGSPTNQMTAVGSKLFVKAGNETIILNTTTNKFTKLDFAAAADSKMPVDKEGKVWILNNDNYKASLIRIDPETEKILLHKELDNITLDEWGARLELVDNTLYFIAIDSDYKPYVYKYSIQADSYSFVFSPSDITYLYGLGSIGFNLVICDATDFSQSGYVLEFSPTGDIINKFKTGITPCFIFKNN